MDLFCLVPCRWVGDGWVYSMANIGVWEVLYEFGDYSSVDLGLHLDCMYGACLVRRGVRFTLSQTI